MNDYSEAVRWLLSSKDPSIRYLTLRDVLGKSGGNGEAKKAKEEILLGDKVQSLLSGQEVDGGFHVHPYRKWTGSHWRLISLVNLEIPKDHKGAIQAARLSLDWLYSAGIKRAFKPINGKVRMHAAVYGNAVYYWSYFGLGTESRVKYIVQAMLNAQWDDGGWNCDHNSKATHSSFHESLATMNGLIAYYDLTGDRQVKASIDRAAELFLSHRIFRSHRTGEIVDQEWLRLRYPVYWHYNFLESLRVLCLVGKGNDRRMRESLDLLEEKSNAQGKWEVEGHYWTPIERDYFSTTKSFPNREIVDWGRDGPNEMITLNALRVLKSTGRLR